jgi:GNAT superfamily N-acetyltransferase
MTSTQIRHLAPEDRAAWTEQWCAYLDFYETELPPAQYDLTWSRLMTDGEDPSGLCAVAPDGRMLGITHYIFHRHGWLPNDVCYLQDLYVVEDQRGTGLGRALIEAVYAAADKAGASQTYWLTQHFNEAGRRLYDRIGVLTPFIKYNRS